MFAGVADGNAVEARATLRAPLPAAPADVATNVADETVGRRASALGDRFREARERQGRTLEDAARHLHLPWRVVDNLERGDWQDMATPIYLRGYLRSYCSLLGLPEPELLTELGQQAAAPQPLVSTGGISRGRFLVERYATAATYLVITALIVVPVIILGVNGGLKDNLAHLAPLDPPALAAPADSENPGVSSEALLPRKPLMASMTPIQLLDPGPERASASVTVPLPAAPVAMATAEVAVAEPHPLSITLNAPSWVEVIAADGERIEYALLEPGIHQYRQSGPLTVRVGNVGAAVVERAGHTLDLGAYERSNVAYFNVDGAGSLHRPPQS